MDSIVVVAPSTCSPFIRNPIKNFQFRPFFTTHLSFFRFTHNSNKRRASSLITFSHRSPSNPEKSNFNVDQRNFLINPIWVLLPLFKTIRNFAISQPQRWASSVRDYIDRDVIKSVDDEFNGCYLQSNGIGLALLSVTTNAKHHISPFVAKLAANPTFVSGLLAWFAAQSTKVILNFFVERKWNLRILFASGGMPSSHSALCTALTTSVALCHGVSDSLFPVCLGFSLIVMYDAIGVRRHAGIQAEVLNMIIADLFKGHPISERKLKELLGHTPSQVVAGALLGIAVSCFCCQGFLIAS